MRIIIYKLLPAVGPHEYHRSTAHNRHVLRGMSDIVVLVAPPLQKLLTHVITTYYYFIISWWRTKSTSCVCVVIDNGRRVEWAEELIRSQKSNHESQKSIFSVDCREPSTIRNH